MSGQRVFITGGTGKIGRFLLNRLEEAGYSIIILTRKSVKDGYSSNIKFVNGDILESQSYIEALRDVDVVLHMAAVTHTNSEEKYFAVNAGGTRELIKAAQESGVKRFIHVSTRAISPAGGGYSRSKIEAEKYVMESGLDWVILRPSEVYGLGGNEGIEMLLGKLDSMPFVPVIGTGKYGIAPLHVSDLIDALLSVIEKSELKNKIYTLAGPENFTYNELIDRIMLIKKIRRARVSVPLFLIEMMARVSALFFGDRFLIVDQVPRLVSEKSSDISLAARELSFKPKKIDEFLVARHL